MKKHICIFVRSPIHAATCPSVFHAVRLLAQNGYAIDLVTTSDHRWRVPAFEGPDVRVLTLSSSVGREIFPGLSLLRYIILSLRACLGQSYHCFIGVDQDGLTAATVFSILKQAPVVYYSLEIRFSSPGSGLLQRLRKRLEKWCHKRASLTIIQDAARARLLLKENQVPDAQVANVPNSSAGPPPSFPKERYWNQKYGILIDRTILLHAGGIADYNCVLELARVAHTWPDNWVLVIHGFGDEAYINQVRQFADGQHVLLSLEMVSPEKLDYLIGSADIGIALYNSNFDPNITQMGLSSGKGFQYLRCGLPVIGSDLPGLHELLVDHGCGVLVSGAEQIESAALEILSKYDEYSSSAHRCYLDHGNFEQCFKRVLGHISQIKDRFRVENDIHL